MLRTLLLLVATLWAAAAALSQNCSPNGNIVIFSNYDGGPLIIDVNQNIPNLKIGIASYEPTAVTFTGAFVGNITEVVYAGYQPFSPGNDHCDGILTTSIQQLSGATTNILNTPPVTLISPLVDFFGFLIPAGDNNGIIGCHTCDNNSYQGGQNTSAQIIDFFLNQFPGGQLKFLKTQYECWCGVQNLDQPPTCCFELNNATAGVNITATPSLSLCDGTTITLDAGPGYNSYFWSNGQTGQTIQVSAPGVYSVFVESDCGEAQGSVLVNPCGSEIFILTEDVTICDGDFAVIFAEAFGGSPPYNYSWSPNLGTGGGPFFVDPPVGTHQYTVTVTDAASTTASATITVTVVLENPWPGFEGPLNLCLGPVTLNANWPGADFWIWSTGEGTPTITVNQPGNYSVSVFGICGVYFDAVDVLPCTGPLAVTLASQTVCTGQSAQLNAVVSGGQGPYTFAWSPATGNGPNISVTPGVTTTYTVAVTDSQGAQATAQATVTVLPNNLQVNLGPDFELCTPGATLNATSAGATSYLWNTGATSPTITVAVPGTYSVTAFGPCGQVSDAVIVLECNELQVTVANATICRGDATTLQATITGGSPPYQVLWFPNVGAGPGPHSVSPDSTRQYIATVIDAAGATVAVSATVTVVQETIDLPWSQTAGLCPGESLELNAFVPDALSYLWSTGSAQPSITVNATGNYSVVITTPCNVLSRSVTVGIVPGAVLPPHPLSVAGCIEDGPVQIGWPFGNEYTMVWSTGEVGPSIGVSQTGLYTGIYNGPCGPKPINYNALVSKCECDIFVPNAFTPADGNGLNDLFKPVLECDLTEYEFLVFDRWGRVLFESNRVGEGWRGNEQTSDYFAPPGVYAWRVRVVPRSGALAGRATEKTGTVVLVR
jgi:hypothetical protein